MKIVYFGTPTFAAKVLEFLLNHNIEICAVITRTDKPKGRSDKPIPTPVKEVAQKHNIPVFQPEKVSDPSFADTLKSFNADLFVVVAYGEILKQHVLDTPKIACINLHASLLPQYRGAAPIQRCIIDGQHESGISIMHMVKKMDAGDVIDQTKVVIGLDTTFGELEEKLCQVGAEKLLDVITREKITATPQDETKVTYAPKIELEDCQINWNQSAQTIHNLVRGVNPYPGAWCYVTINGQKKRLKILKTKITTEKKGLTVDCGQGFLTLLEVQLEGKKAMDAESFQRGNPKLEFEK